MVTSSCVHKHFRKRLLAEGERGETEREGKRGETERERERERRQTPRQRKEEAGHW